MHSQDDIDAMTAIGTWNQQHGGLITDMSQALDDLIAALGRYDVAQDNVAELNAAGRRLATVAHSSLDAPRTGIPQFDEPRLESLRSYERAGQLCASYDPAAQGDEQGFDAGILISRGREVAGMATEYTQQLVKRQQR